VDDAADLVLGQPDEGKTRTETIARRLSDTVGSSSWWLETLSIDDGSGAQGDNSGSWDLNVYFDPHAPGSTRLVDFEGDETEAAAARREKARLQYKRRQFSDDLYSGRGTVPQGGGSGGAGVDVGGAARNPEIRPVGTLHEADYPDAPRRFVSPFACSIYSLCST
jgi:hypothetical protein